MKKILVVLALVSGLTALALSFSCSSIGGADVTLEDVSLGTVTMDGRSVAGLPSDRVNLSLDVSAQKIIIKRTTEGAIMTLFPSGATLEIKPGVISMKGVKPEQLKVEWVTKEKE